MTMIVGLLPLLLIVTASKGAETREEAVAAAREGRTEEAIAALRKLLAEGSDPLLAYDLAVILTWVNRPREATDAFERAGTGEAPAYVLAPIVRAYRDQKRFAEAERWAREGERRYPIDSTWPKLLGLVLADQKRADETITLLKPWAATQPDDPEIWLALGYAALRSGDRFETLRAYCARGERRTEFQEHPSHGISSFTILRLQAAGDTPRNQSETGRFAGALGRSRHSA